MSDKPVWLRAQTITPGDHFSPSLGSVFCCVSFGLWLLEVVKWQQQVPIPASSRVLAQWGRRTMPLKVGAFRGRRTMSSQVGATDTRFSSPWTIKKQNTIYETTLFRQWIMGSAWQGSLREGNRRKFLGYSMKGEIQVESDSLPGKARAHRPEWWREESCPESWLWRPSQDPLK